MPEVTDKHTLIGLSGPARAAPADATGGAECR